MLPRSRRSARRLPPLGGILSAGLALAALGCGGSSAKPPQSSAGSQAPSSTGASTSPAPVAAGAASATGPATVSASSGGVTATMHAGTHHPKVNAPWPIHFLVTQGGAPAPASVSYEYLFGGQVVAHRSHYTFNGHFSDVFMWPASAVGYPLTFRAVIVRGAVTINLDYAVQVTA